MSSGPHYSSKNTGRTSIRPYVRPSLAFGDTSRALEGLKQHRKPPEEVGTVLEEIGRAREDIILYCTVSNYIVQNLTVSYRTLYRTLYRTASLRRFIAGDKERVQLTLNVLELYVPGTSPEERFGQQPEDL